MITSLQATYGGDPGAWLRMPTGVLRAFITALPARRAEAALLDSQVVAVGTGSLEKRDRKAVIRGWEQDARGDEVERTKPTREERDMMIAAVGIKRG